MLQPATAPLCIHGQIWISVRRLLEGHFVPNTAVSVAGQARRYTSPPTIESMGKCLWQKPVLACASLQGSGSAGGEQGGETQLSSLLKFTASGK